MVQLTAMKEGDRPIDDGDATYFVDREAVSQGDMQGVHPTLEHLYTLLRTPLSAAPESSSVVVVEESGSSFWA